MDSDTTKACAFRFLKRRVLVDKETVTYRHLARHLSEQGQSITSSEKDQHDKQSVNLSNAAKQFLYLFYAQESESKDSGVEVAATYIVIGAVPATKAMLSNGSSHANGTETEDSKDGEDDKDARDEVEEVTTTSLSLIPQDKLPDAKKTFISISSIHIYSLHPRNNNRDTFLSVESNSSLPNLFENKEQSILLGIIQSSSLLNTSSKKSVDPPETVKTEGKKTATNTSSETVPNKKTTPSRSESKMKEKYAEKPTSKTKRSESKESSAPVKKESSGLSKSQSNSNLLEDLDFTADPFSSSTGQPQSSSQAVRSPKSSRKNQQVIDDEEIDDEDTPKRNKRQKTSDGDHNESTTDANFSADKEPGEKKKHVKKIRKVSRKETTLDERGYRRTVNVEEDEEYTGTESEPESTSLTGKKKLKSSTPQAETGVKRTTSATSNVSTSSTNSNTKTKPPQRGQTNLSSFFTKKDTKKK